MGAAVGNIMARTIITHMVSVSRNEPAAKVNVPDSPIG